MHVMKVKNPFLKFIIVVHLYCFVYNYIILYYIKVLDHDISGGILPSECHG